MFTTPTSLVSPLVALRRALRCGLDADLSGVRLVFASDLPVDGIACGDTVVLSSALLRAPVARLLHVAVHELVHVFQQHNGRVPAATRVGHLAFCLDPALEAEAETAARTVVRGGRIPLRRSARAPLNAPVIQPLLTVNGHACASESDLSARFIRLLGLVPQGPAWLSWALRAPGNAGTFADEFTLLTSIQLGLLGTAPLGFQSAGIRLSPAGLLNVADPDFGNIVGSLQTGQLTPAASAALVSYGACTESNFAALDQSLASLGVSASLALAAPTLAEQVNLYALLVGQPPAAGAPTIAAAQFAAANAQTATDFAAAFSFYLTVCPGADTPPVPPAQLWTQLCGQVFPYLQSPSLDPYVPDNALAAFVTAYLRRSSFVGFPSQAVAVAQIAAHAGLPLDQPVQDSASDQIRTYVLSLAAIAGTVTDGVPAQPRVTRLQDGLTRWLDYAGPAGSARLQLDAAGLLTVRSLSPASTS